MRRVILMIICSLMFLSVLPPIQAHEVDHDKRLYYNSYPDMYSNMNIYLVSVDQWWYDVVHAHQSFKFGRSTVTESKLEYFKIWNQQNREIYSFSGSARTSDYDNSMNPNVSIYKGNNYLRMRVANKDVRSSSGHAETYYWYEDVFWENVN